MIIILALMGACIGSLVNYCIYNLGYQRWPISPFSRPNPNNPRTFVHYIPILGWLNRRSERNEDDQRIWFRPFAIEWSLLVAIPLFYVWHQANGMTGGVAAPAGWTTIWFVGHSILFVLLLVATFIDFDQRIIPDSITITGTFIALTIAAFYPGFRLPEVTGNIAGPVVDSIDFADGANKPAWHYSVIGLIVSIAIFWTWILALLPKLPLLALNWLSLKKVFVSTCRLLQKNNLKARERSRRMGWTFLFLGLIGTFGIVAAWVLMPAARWDSFFGALVGLGFGGMMVWSVRIVASHSLGQEAMGFGDVTLMAMIGAFLGWQASLITFALSPFAALAIVLVNFLVTKENELAFGPYLCLGALITVLAWKFIWPMLRPEFFAMPSLLVGVLTMSLAMLAVMMLGIRKLKGM